MHSPKKLNPCLVLCLTLSACAAEDKDQLVENFSPAGGGLIWTCPDGTQFVLDDTLTKQSTICLGIDGSECREPGVPGPGDTECDDPSFNAFKDSCVEEFFSCFKPTGTCTLLANGNQEWANGALQDRDYMGFIAAYFQSAGTDPCVTATLGSGRVFYSR